MLLFPSPESQVCLSLAQMFYTFLRLSFPALKGSKMKTERTWFSCFFFDLLKAALKSAVSSPFPILYVFSKLFKPCGSKITFCCCCPPWPYLYSAIVMGGSVVILICFWRMFSSYKQTEPLLDLLKNAGLKLFVFLLPIANYSCEN